MNVNKSSRNGLSMIIFSSLLDVKVGCTNWTSFLYELGKVGWSLYLYRCSTYIGLRESDKLSLLNFSISHQISFLDSDTIIG